MILTLAKEYIVCFAPGWPDPYRPTPNTKEEALKFCHQHGGKIKSRYRTPWKTEKPDDRDYRKVLVASPFEHVSRELKAEADLVLLSAGHHKDRYGGVA